MSYFLFVLGAIFGSFVNALVWRLHNREEKSKNSNHNRPTSILNGRSVCESCGHELAIKDLIPILSWLSLKGKCRYCKKSVSIQNPIVEISTSLIFGLSYHFWPLEFNDAGIFHFVAWLTMLVILMTMLVYDLRWLILPNRLVYPLIVLAIFTVAIDAIVFDGGADSIRTAVIGLAVIGGFFFALFQLSKGRWIGGGDVKLAMFIGIFLGLSKGLVALYVGFISASLIMVPLLLSGRIRRDQPVPFGPFLILGIFVATIWGQELLDWYDEILLLDVN